MSECSPLTIEQDPVECLGMAKTIRFGDLVRASGRPQTVTLWTKPEEDPALSRAIKQNRVLTVLQETGKKDHGLIGFKLLPGALYLEFPTQLQGGDEEARVVGINYQLIDEPPVPKEKLAKPALEKTIRKKPETHSLPPKEPPPVLQKPKPRLFTVIVRRTASIEEEISVKALDQSEAERHALERAKNKAFKPGSAVQVEVVRIV